MGMDVLIQSLQIRQQAGKVRQHGIYRVRRSRIHDRLASNCCVFRRLTLEPRSSDNASLRLRHDREHSQVAAFHATEENETKRRARLVIAPRRSTVSNENN